MANLTDREQKKIERLASSLFIALQNCAFSEVHIANGAFKLAAEKARQTGLTVSAEHLEAISKSYE